MSVTVL